MKISAVNTCECPSYLSCSEQTYGWEITYLFKLVGGGYPGVYLLSAFGAVFVLCGEGNKKCLYLVSGG